MRPLDYPTPRYQSYMLRCWEVCSQTPNQPAIWRFSLEDPQTGEKIGFADFASLIAFLQAEFDPQADGISGESQDLSFNFAQSNP